MASELIELLECEARSPGNALRKRLMKEEPDLRPTSNNGEEKEDEKVLEVHVLFDHDNPLSKTNQALFGNCQDEPSYRNSSAMSLIGPIDEEDDCQNSNHSSDDYDSFNGDEDPYGYDLSTEFLKKRVITHIVSCDFDLTTSKHSNNAEDPLNLNSKSNEELKEIYQAALDVHDEALGIPCSFGAAEREEGGVVGGICKQFRESKINGLLEKIVGEGHGFALLRGSREEKTERESMMVGISAPGQADIRSSLAIEADREAALASMDIPGGPTSSSALPPVPPPGVSPPSESAIKPVISFTSRYTPLVPPSKFNFWECRTPQISMPSGGQKTEGGLLFYKGEVGKLKELVERVLEKNGGGEEKPELKLVLMGTNIIIHKYLCAYSALYSTDQTLISSVDIKLYIIPEGQNDLGRFLAWTDKWYERHIFNLFARMIPLAPHYSITEAFPSSVLDECEMHGTLPVNLLREMAQHYVRCAEHVGEVKVHDVRCWTNQDPSLRRLSHPVAVGADPDGEGRLAVDDANNNANNNANEKELERASISNLYNTSDKLSVFGIVPDLVVPFATSIEIGLLTSMESYKYQMMSQSSTMKDLLMSKEFIKDFAGFETVPLTITYRPSDLEGNATRETEEIHGEFVSVSICNVPEGIRGFETSYVEGGDKFGQWNGLTMCLRKNRGTLKELLNRKTKLSAVEADKFIETMTDKSSFGVRQKSVGGLGVAGDEEVEDGADKGTHGDDHHHHNNDKHNMHAAKEIMVGTVSIQVSRPRDTFHILSDGNVIGPLKKITIGPSAVLHGQDGDVVDFKLPLHSFFPHQGEGAGEGMGPSLAK